MAKEKFQDRRLTGSLSVVCKNDNGTQQVWKANKADVVRQIVEVVEAYQKMGYKLTLRQLHYQFVGRNWIVNHTIAYKKLGTILDDCRYAGLIDWDAIEDRGRVPKLPYWVTGIADALNDTINSYRLNRQAGQEKHIEVWTEKDALSGIMWRSCSLYHVRLVVNKGYTSSSAIYAAYERFKRIIENGQEVVILYFGDHDPSGLDMVRDVRERIEFMFQNGEKADSGLEDYFQVIPIGLTKKQIKQYKLPPNPTKLTDTRAAQYIKEHGKICWEVDALDAPVLTSILQSNIEANMEMELYQDMISQEVKHITKLKKFVKDGKY